MYDSKKWLYTAVTRATDLKMVYFNDYDSSKDNEKEAEPYFARKVKRYRQHEKERKRAIDKMSYITNEWLPGCSGSPAAFAAPA